MIRTFPQSFQLFSVLTVLCIVGLLVTGTPSAKAAIMFDGTTYTENFDSLPLGLSPNEDQSWADDSTLPGWSSAHSSRSSSIRGWLHSSQTFSGGGAEGLFAFAHDDTPDDRALGGREWGAGTKAFWIAVELVNNTANPLNEVIIGYTAEQWQTPFNASGDSDRIVEYSFDASGPGDDTGWTEIPSLRFDTPNESSGASPINGEAAGNRQVFAPTTVTLNETWDPGETLWIGFRQNIDKTTNLAAVDDFSFAIPEPSTLALLGLGGAVMIAGRRRRD